VLIGNDIWDENNGGGDALGAVVDLAAVAADLGAAGSLWRRRAASVAVGSGGQAERRRRPARAQGIDPERLKELQLRNRRARCRVCSSHSS
jgi:hypothetical protein